jgi:hypothetical protein
MGGAEEARLRLTGKQRSTKTSVHHYLKTRTLFFGRLYICFTVRALRIEVG